MRLKEEELCQWLAREARKGGKNLPLPAAQRLVEVVGDNLAELTQELEKLTLFAGPESTLTPNLVSRLASHSRTYNIFALVDALGEANPQKRLTALDHLSDLGEPPVRILGMLARQLRLLIQIKEHPAGTPLEPLASKFSIPVGVLGRLSRQARAFSLDSLKTHLKVLHQADRQQKTSTSNPRLWLEWALLKMGPG
jgi:DNA polymerase-3 subunit delta